MKAQSLLLLVLLVMASLAGCHRVHYPIDINTTPAADLAELPGIGPKYADAIIAGRPFKTVNDVERVKGIGPKTLAKIRDKITVGEKATAPGK